MVCPHQTSGSEASASELLQEVQEAQEKVRAAEEELTSTREHSHKLQQELQVTHTHTIIKQSCKNMAFKLWRL